MDIKRGVACFTFDDSHFEGWEKALPIFEKYNAHATFFLSGDIDERAAEAALKLYNAGHSIGLHTKNHTDAPEYFEKYGGEMYYEAEIRDQKKKLEESGIPIMSFAYPNNRHNEETDRFLGRYFKRFRAGNSQSEEKFFSVDLIGKRRIMEGFGIGEYYNTVEEELLAKLRFTAEKNVCMTFFSHNIMEAAPHIHMPASLLEKCLAVAQQEGVRVIGFDEVPCCEGII